MKDLAEVCPLSRVVMLQPLSLPLQQGLRFFRLPSPAISSARLTAAYPTANGRYRAYRVSLREPSGLGPLYPPVAFGVHERARKIASARHGAFWLKPVSIFGLLPGYDVYQAFSFLNHATHSSPRSALMLADPFVPLRLLRQHFC